jgi:hypothetical protein
MSFLAYFVASAITITAEYIALAISTATEIWFSLAARRFETDYEPHCNNKCKEKLNIHDAWLIDLSQIKKVVSRQDQGKPINIKQIP